MNKRELQESEYQFPYHHIPQFGLDSFSETRHLFWGYEYAAYTERILKVLSERPFDSLLDVGCGDGRLLLEIHKMFPHTRLVGTDFSQRAVSFARAFAPGIDFRAGTLTETIPPQNHFSYLTLIEVLEHIPLEEAPLFLKQCISYLASDGRAIITVPSTLNPVTPKHFRHFTAESLHETLEPHCKIISIEYLSARTFGVQLLRRLFANRLFILNERHIVEQLYHLYVRRYLHANSKNGQRLIAVIEKKSIT